MTTLWLLVVLCIIRAAHTEKGKLVFFAKAYYVIGAAFAGRNFRDLAKFLEVRESLYHRNRQQLVKIRKKI